MQKVWTSSGQISTQSSQQVRLAQDDGKRGLGLRGVAFMTLVRETKDTVRVSLQEYLFTGSSKVTSCGFWKKRVRLSDLLEGGLTVRQEPTLTVLLVLPRGFVGFGGFGERLALLLLVLQIQCQETTVTVSAVSVVTATPHKFNPLFSSS